VTHEAVTKVPGSFERSVRGLRLLHERGVVTRLKCVLMAENVDEREAIGELGEELGATAQFDPQLTPRNDGDVTPVEHRLDDDVLKLLLASDQEYSAVEGDVPLCSAARDAVSISPSGDVNPCVQMPYSLGSLRDKPFSEIWKGDVADEIRSLTLSKLSRCSACSDIRFCNPCLGLNLIETGDATRPSSSVCRMARARRKGVMA
jgi:radical SAM protein with 4Fe4S-binding SPASM domain